MRKLGESITETLFVTAIREKGWPKPSVPNPSERLLPTGSALERQYPSTGPRIVKGPYAAAERLPR